MVLFSAFSLQKKDLEFVMANGQVITRSVGFAIVRVEEHFTVDEIVFAEEGDPLLLGARGLAGLNVMVDSRRKKLVAAWPLPAAGAWRSETKEMNHRGSFGHHQATKRAGA